MFNNERIFWLGFGILYITEMRRVYNKNRTSELKIKSKELAQIWYSLCKKYKLLSKKNKGLKEKDGVYTFGCNAYSLYRLLSKVKKLPESGMDKGIRLRIQNFTYLAYGPWNKTRIKILKILNKYSALTTNELARKINFPSSNVFRNHLNALEELGFLKRNKIGKQKIINIITKRGLKFINKYISEIENIPNYSLYTECLKNKKLAADLMLIISELEMGGIMQRQPYLAMNSYEFVIFIHKVCKKWGWTNHQNLSKREIKDYKPIYQFSLNSKSIRNIYELAGPCADPNKDQEFKYALNLRKPGSHKKIGETKRHIIKLISNGFDTSRKLAFNLGIGVQNVHRPLKALTEKGIITRFSKNGKYYYKIN